MATKTKKQIDRIAASIIAQAAEYPYADKNEVINEFFNIECEELSFMEASLLRDALWARGA